MSYEYLIDMLDVSILQKLYGIHYTGWKKLKGINCDQAVK